MGDSIGEKVKRWRELADSYYPNTLVHAELREAADEVEKLYKSINEEIGPWVKNQLDAGDEYAEGCAAITRECSAENEKLKARLARLEEALRWYATEAHKQKDVYGAGMNSLPQYLWYDDKGERARRALAEQPS